MTPIPASVPDGTCVYAVGDIHGRHDLLIALQEMIVADAGRRNPERRVVVYLGDYVDRGPESRAVVEALATTALPGFEVVHLIGNHESFLLRFLQDAEVGPIWFYNGGACTLESYGVEAGALDRAALAAAQDDFQEVLPARHEQFLRGLALSHVEGDYAFVHAGVRPGIPLAEQRAEDLMWIRDEFLDANDNHGHVIVHGHSIAWEPEVRVNRIGIDTGAFASGVLTALVLDGAERGFLQTKGH
ncbi:MAG: serine/threonine protein phosphatase [Alphaproteobacteria bacterium]|nr:serine/threonine protein phosphatase [Alphaproteobacteria bacterium]